MDDRQLLGDIVVRLIARQYGTVSEFLRRHPDIKRRSMDRIKAGDPKVLPRTIMRVEGALGLPTDFLIHAARHDLEALAASGADPDTIRWVSDLIRSGEAPSAERPRSTRRNRSAS